MDDNEHIKILNNFNSSDESIENMAFILSQLESGAIILDIARDIAKKMTLEEIDKFSEFIKTFKKSHVEKPVIQPIHNVQKSPNLT